METNSGVWLDRTLRVGACGTWWSAGTAGGQPLGMLRIEPDLIAQPAARERVAAAVAAVRAANPPGVLRTTELVMDTRQAWLVVATLPKPTLADVLAPAATLPSGAAAGLAVDVANALRELHAAGLGHGDLSPDSVILTGAGVATLAEVGVLAAARDVATDIGRDYRAWACLVRELANASTTFEADLLRAAAATAESGDLPTAARRLAVESCDLPDFVTRDALATLVPTVTHVPPPVPPRRNTADLSTMDADGTAVRVRFGPGVPLSATVAAAPATETPPRQRRRWVRAVASVAAVALLVLGAGAAVWWLVLR